MSHKLFSLKNLIWFCAIGLAVFSGYYSVYGISKLFSGGSWSIVGMAGMLEFSKLVVITFLHDHYKTLKTTFKIYLMSAAAVLMILTSVGVYGYLTNSYQETAKSIYETQNKIALIDKKKYIYLEQKSQIDTLVKQKSQRISSYDQLRLTQENSLNTQLSSKKGTKGLQRNIQSVDNSTQTLNKEISELNQKSIGLSDSIAKLEQEKLGLENSTFTSEIGPLLYLSRLTGAPMDMIVNWFILILVSVFDPLAVSLVIAANHLRHKENELPPEDNNSPPPNDIEKIEEVIDVIPPTEEIKTQVESQITDAVTVTKKQKSKKIKKEKKVLADTKEISILGQDDIERAFYEEPSKPDMGYRRGISL
jgi:hypothetical protein